MDSWLCNGSRPEVTFNATSVGTRVTSDPNFLSRMGCGTFILVPSGEFIRTWPLGPLDVDASPLHLPWTSFLLGGHDV